MPTDPIILHNPRCSKSRAALAAAETANITVTTVLYLKEPLDANALKDLLSKLEDPAPKLVRRDAKFAALNLTDADVDTADKVVAVLSEHPELMERPVIIRGDRAIIGRPTERVPEFLGNN